MIARQEISSVEVTRLQLDRIAAVNPAINAVVELDPDRALAAAAAADQAVAHGERLGPLHGVPMTIKDSFNAAGLHTTWGNPAFKDFVADTDATIVNRLKQAGAIVIGKTNVHFMLSDFGQTANELYGVTNNPWDTEQNARRIHRRRCGGAGRRADLPGIRLGSGGFDPHSGELLRGVRTQADRGDRAVDRVRRALQPAGTAQHDAPVGDRPAGPIGGRSARRAAGDGRTGTARSQRRTPGRWRRPGTGGWRISGSVSCSMTRPPRCPARSATRCPTPSTHWRRRARRSSTAGRKVLIRSSNRSRSGSRSGCSSPSRRVAPISPPSPRWSTRNHGGWPPGTAWDRYFDGVDVFLHPEQLHRRLPARQQTIRRAHHQHPGG